MKRILLLLGIGAVLGTSAFAAGTCTVNTLNNLVTAGYYCDLGSLRFSNFQFLAGSGPVTDTTIQMNPVVAGQRMGWTVSGTSAWSFNSNVSFTILFQVMALAGGGVQEVNAVLTNPSTAPTLVGLDSTINEVPLLDLYLTNNSGPLTDSAYFSPLMSVTSSNEFTISGSRRTAASLDSATIMFSNVPEPLTFGLVGGGLLGLALLRRRTA